MMKTYADPVAARLATAIKRRESYLERRPTREPFIDILCLYLQHCTCYTPVRGDRRGPGDRPYGSDLSLLSRL